MERFKSSKTYRKLSKAINGNGEKPNPNLFFSELAQIESPNKFDWLTKGFGADKFREAASGCDYRYLIQVLRTTRAALLEAITDTKANEQLPLANHVWMLNTAVESGNSLHAGPVPKWDEAFWLAWDRIRVRDTASILYAHEVNQMICGQLLSMRSETGADIHSLLRSFEIPQQTYASVKETVSSPPVKKSLIEIEEQKIGESSATFNQAIPMLRNVDLQRPRAKQSI